MSSITRCAAGVMAAGALLLGGGGEQAQAAACTNMFLSDALTAGFSCTQQDKTFSNFTASGFSSGAFLSFQLFSQGGTDRHTITATDTFVPDTNYTLQYTISINTPGVTFADVSAGLLAAAGATGTAQLTESFPGSPLADIIATPAQPFPPPDAVPAGITSITASDLFFTDGTDVTGFSNTFSETVPVPTPEPASLLLLGSGLVAVGLMRRRR